MNKLLFLLMLFLGLVLKINAQEEKGKLIQGLLISDSLELENVTVSNKTLRINTVSDIHGKFAIRVREKDTLIFTSPTFNSLALVVTNTILEDELVKVRLSIKVNQLDEVIVWPYTLTGNLETDSKKLKVKVVNLNLGSMKIETGVPKSNSVNDALKSITPGSGNNYNGIDFVALGKGLAKTIFKTRPKHQTIEFITEKNFSEAVKEKFSNTFFSDTLKLKPDEVPLFLSFCQADEVKIRELLNPKKEFELIDFLLKKSEEFHKINQ